MLMFGDSFPATRLPGGAPGVGVRPPITLLDALTSIPALREPGVPLANAAVPLMSVPTKLPCTRFPVALLPLISTPRNALPEIMLRATGVVPPIVLLLPPEMATPPWVFAIAALPAELVPMRLPCTVLALALAKISTPR